MKKVMNSKIILSFLSIVLVAAMALSFSSCEKNVTTKPDAENKTEINTPAVEKSFVFVVTELDGTEKTFNITTEKNTLGEALLEEELVTIENGMVLSVNGQRYEYNADGVYWAFYIDGEFVMTGVNETEVVDGTVYGFTATKA